MQKVDTATSIHPQPKLTLVGGRPLKAVTITAAPRLLPLTLQLGDGVKKVSSNWILAGPLQWKAWIYSQQGRRDRTEFFYGISDKLTFTIDFGPAVQGGAITIVIAPLLLRRVPDGMLMKLSIPNTIVPVVGTHPSAEDVKVALQIRTMQVISYINSRFKQFDATGAPLGGLAAGCGVLQIKEATTEQTWNWRANIAAGLALLAEKRIEVETHYKEVRELNPDAPALSAKQLQLALFQRYNGGWYWTWDRPKSMWIKQNNTQYADRAFEIEKAVASGKPPPDW